MKLTDVIVQLLIQRKIKHIFGYTGGSIADFVDSVYKASPAITFIETRHEQGAAFAANAYANLTGNIGVATASSGPGAINLLNGIANAYYDSIPCLFITGNVHTLGRKTSSKIRQNAFQETNIVELARSITKKSFYVDNAAVAVDMFNEAIKTAVEGRPGPVLIDIPYDIQRAEIKYEHVMNCAADKTLTAGIDRHKLVNLSSLLAKARRPVIVLGGGCINLKKKLEDVLDKAGIPVVVTMRGLDTISHDKEYFSGMIGSYGNRWANLALCNSDFLLVLGARLDERQIGYRRNSFAPKAKIVQVDIDKYELGRKVDTEINILSNVENFLESAKDYLYVGNYRSWLELIKQWSERYPSYNLYKDKLCANDFLNYVTKKINNAVIVADVGINQAWTAQSVHLKNETRFLCSGGLGSMGYSLPAAIGASFAFDKELVLSINGDGGLQMNIQEMQTAAHYNLPIKIIVLNNNCLGMIRSLQRKMFDGRYYASVDDYSAPDWHGIASTYGFDYCMVQSACDYDEALSYIFSEKKVLIEVKLLSDEMPAPDAGSEIIEQLPLLSEKDVIRIKKEVELIS